MTGRLPRNLLQPRPQPDDGFWRLPVAGTGLLPATVVLTSQDQPGPAGGQADAHLLAAAVYPRVILVRRGQVLNLHNLSGRVLQCRAEGDLEFDTGDIKPGTSFSQQLNQAGQARLVCPGLAQSRALLLVAAGLWSSETDDTGAFSIRSVPAGKYRLLAFADGRRIDQRPLQVSGGKMEVDFATSPAPATSPAAAAAPGKPAPSTPAAKPTPARPAGKPAAAPAAAPKPAPVTKPAPVARPAPPQPRPAPQTPPGTAKQVGAKSGAGAASPPPTPAGAAAAAKADRKPAEKPRPAGPKPGSTGQGAGEKPAKPKDETPVFQDVEPEIEIVEE